MQNGVIDTTTPRFAACVGRVKDGLIYKGDAPLRTSAPRIDGQSVHSDGHEDVLSQDMDCYEHIAMAKNFSIPQTSNVVEPHLRAAASYVAGHARNPELLHAARLHKLQVLQQVASDMAADDSTAKKHLTKFAKPIGSRFAIALLTVMLHATSYPDAKLADDLVLGVPNIGDIPITGSHLPCEVPSTRSSLEAGYPAKLIGSMRKRASKATAQQQRGFTDCYEKTLQEVTDGWAEGPFTKDEMDKEFPGGWHCSERFAQYRYEGAPCRPCDNFKTSGINDFNSYHEKLVCENAGFPSRMGALFYSIFNALYSSGMPPDCEVIHGTDDLTKAYRQITVRNYAYNVIAIWNPHLKRVEFFVLRGLPFGSAASVLQFNRYSQFMAYFAAVYLGICCTSYYDDYDVTEPMYSATNGQQCLWRLHRTIGFILDKDKHVRAAANNNAFLGVVTDFSDFARGLIYLRISASRKSKILSMLRSILLQGSLTSAQASSLRGKLYFCMLTAFNKVGRGQLRAFTERQYSRASFLSAELRDAIIFFSHLIPNMRPRCIDMHAVLRATLIIWSDAMYESGTGGIGFVAYDPDIHRYFYSAHKVPRWVYLFFRVLQTYIGQLEILAVLFAYTTIPHSLTRGRKILHYIDNTSSMAGAIKGSSPKRDSAWMLTVLHIIFSLLDIAPWFAYVASKANCSDGPSRFDFSFVSTLRAEWLHPIPLTLAEWSRKPHEWIPVLPPRFKRATGAQRRATKKASVDEHSNP